MTPPTARPATRPADPARRALLRGAAAGAALVALGPAVVRAMAPRAAAPRTPQGAAPQDAAPQDAAPPAQSAAGGVEMTSDSYKPVRRPPKAGAARVLDDKQVETLERTLACPCPCTLDIYTCRTTDFTCGISPAVHGDIMRLVEGGYGADEIMTALLDSYGDFILMSPRKQGFNLLAWITPAAAIAGGAVAIGVLLRRWRRPAGDAGAPASAAPVADATPEELARLAAALREDR